MIGKDDRNQNRFCLLFLEVKVKPVDFRRDEFILRQLSNFIEYRNYAEVRKMGYLEITIILGIVFLLFRIWLDEIKLVDELQFRRRYFSRVFSYYTCLALVFGLLAYPFNIMVMVAFPILIVTSIWDINFFRRFNSQTYWKKNRRWLLIERLTMHPPVVIVALFMMFNGAKNYIQPPNLAIMALIITILFTPFFIFDKRWTKRYKWPEALIVIGLIISSSLSLMIAEALLWGVPLW